MRETKFTPGPWEVENGNVYQSPLLPVIQVTVNDEPQDHRQGLLALVYPSRRADEDIMGY